MNWIEGEPSDNGKYLFTIEHSDGGRTVKFGRMCDNWANAKVVAYIPQPEPFGGRRLPIDPEKLAKYCKTLRPPEVAKALGVSGYDLHIAVGRYSELKEIWQNRPMIC